MIAKIGRAVTPTWLLFALLVGSLGSTPSVADIIDLYGLGSRNNGRGGIAAGIAGDPDSAIVNPAALTTMRQKITYTSGGVRTACTSDILTAVIWISSNQRNRSGTTEPSNALENGRTGLRRHAGWPKTSLTPTLLPRMRIRRPTSKHKDCSTTFSRRAPRYCRISSRLTSTEESLMGP